MKINKKAQNQININSNISQYNKEPLSFQKNLERIQVFVRIRPFNSDELEKDRTSPIEVLDTKNNAMIFRREYDKKNFSYDRIFPENSTQKEIFSITSQNIIDSVLSGYNGTIFAYGQTGSGKTYTMVGEFGQEKFRGIIPRTFDYIFERIKSLQKEDITSKYNINIAFIQIYLEMIQDLFEPNNQVKIREDPDKGVFLENCLWIKIKNPEEFEQVFKKGEKKSKHRMYKNERE